VRHAPNGIWLTTTGGITVLVAPEELRRPSRDARWHVCITLDATDTPVVACVFEPPNS